jgi:hypothetical protein
MMPQIKRELPAHAQATSASQEFADILPAAPIGSKF